MQKTFRVKGMHCKSCEMLIADSLEELGVDYVKASFKDGKVEVGFDESRIPDKKIREIIKKEGYEVI